MSGGLSYLGKKTESRAQPSGNYCNSTPMLTSEKYTFCAHPIIHLDLRANIRDIQLIYGILATESKVPDVGLRSRCIVGCAQMVWLIAKSINLAARMKTKTASGVRFKFDWCSSWLVLQ